MSVPLLEKKRTISPLFDLFQLFAPSLLLPTLRFLLIAMVTRAMRRATNRRRTLRRLAMIPALPPFQILTMTPRTLSCPKPPRRTPRSARLMSMPTTPSEPRSRPSRIRTPRTRAIKTRRKKFSTPATFVRMYNTTLH